MAAKKGGKASGKRRQTNLLSDLVSTPPRETAGARSSNRFDFQKAWGLCRLLELHEEGNDYLIVFDYHEDILVLDSPTTPTAISFYQIKSRTASQGAWTRTRLLKRDKGAEGKPLFSPLGKLYGNLITFPHQTKELCFVSNALFDVPLKDTEGKSATLNRIGMSQLADAELTIIRAQLREEHALDTDPDGESITSFQVTDLSLTDHATHSVGKLETFLQRLHPDLAISTSALHKTLFGEIGRRTNEETPPKTIDELTKRKSLCRADFQEMLASIAKTPRLDEVVTAIRSRLDAEQVPFHEANSLCAACKQFYVDRLNKTNAVLAATDEKVVAMLSEFQTASRLPDKLCEAVTMVIQEGGGSFDKVRELYSEVYLKAMVAVRLYGL